jgi:hypothetical protein
MTDALSATKTPLPKRGFLPRKGRSITAADFSTARFAGRASVSQFTDGAT